MAKSLDKWLGEKNLTRAEFAEAVGIEYGTVSRWFGGKKISRPKKMARDAIAAQFPDCPLLPKKKSGAA